MNIRLAVQAVSAIRSSSDLSGLLPVVVASILVTNTVHLADLEVSNFGSVSVIAVDANQGRARDSP